MSNALAVTVADAIETAWLAAHVAGRISQPIAVERTYTRVPETKLRELTDWSSDGGEQNGVIKVYIQAGDETAETDDMTRGILPVSFDVLIGIACRVKDTTPANVDPLKLLTQELRDYCFQEAAGYQLGDDLPGAVGIRNLYDPHLEYLRNERLFLSAFTLSFLGGRSIG